MVGLCLIFACAWLMQRQSRPQLCSSLCKMRAARWPPKSVLRTQKLLYWPCSNAYVRRTTQVASRPPMYPYIPDTHPLGVYADDARNPHSTKHLASICKQLAPAVVRPAPLQCLLLHAMRSASPWRWASGDAEITFDPDGIVGALSTPWGDDAAGARYLGTRMTTCCGPLSRGVPTCFARACSIVSHRCETTKQSSPRSADSIIATRSRMLKHPNRTGCQRGRRCEDEGDDA